MKTLLALCLASGMLAAAHASPLVVQERARIANPDAAFDGVTGVGLDGDDAIIMQWRYIPAVDEENGDAEEIVPWLFRRVGGTWTAVRELGRAYHDQYSHWGTGIAMQGGLAVMTSPFMFLERRNGAWMQAVVAPGADDGPGTAVEIDNGRVITGFSSGTYEGALRERDAAGVWRQTASMFGEYRGGDDSHEGSDVSLSGTKAIVMSPSSDDTYDVPAVSIHQYTPEYGWNPYFTLRQSRYDFDVFTEETMIRGEEVFITGGLATHVLAPTTYPDPPDYRVRDHLQPLDSYMASNYGSRLGKSDQYVLRLSHSWDRNAGVIQVYVKNAEGRYENVVTLAASGGESLGTFAISGRRVLAACGGQTCEFELPTTYAQPDLQQDTFAGVTPTGWTVSPGSQFSLAQSGASRVLRQAETASTATHTAVWSATADWRNQAVEADVRATAFNGNDRWLGLATRYRDAANYYYVTLRSSGSVSLRKNVNGVFTPLATAPLAVALNRSYRVRLQSIGTRHQVYVDGVPMLAANDSAIAGGSAAVLTYRAAAEFDNLVASPTPALTEFAADFTQYWLGGWTTGGGLWSNVERGTNRVFEQSSVAGDARAFIGVPTDAQTIEVRVRPTTFAGTGGGERWVGIAARYQDVNNYYYLSLRSSNSISLRKRVNGQIAVLGTATLPVTVGTWYTLRLEAVGTQVRAYVNGTLLMEAADASHANGVGGLLTYRAAADFDDFKFVQP